MDDGVAGVEPEASPQRQFVNQAITVMDGRPRLPAGGTSRPWPVKESVMNIQSIERNFAKIGARAKIRFDAARSRRVGIAIDIRRDREGEYFDIAVGRENAPELNVLDAQPRLRHLLLMSRDDEDAKHKFLCGHDERHWFVAAVPERAPASTVKTAFEALKPAFVRFELNRKGVKRKLRNRRRNDAFLRQGEWFFVPSQRQNFPKLTILRHEPLRRGIGKPHICEELVRFGGETVYVSSRYPNGVTPGEHRKLISRKPELANENWVTQRRNPSVFVRGTVRHADHKTIVLNGWHHVLMNTETQAVAMRHVAFID